MSKINVLDCTLRDGGYCNQWDFGQDNIKKIIKGLNEAEIDIIECGFLTNRTQYNQDITKYTNIHQIEEMTSGLHAKKKLVVMINYGEYNAEDLPPCEKSPIDGIRVAFHKKDARNALELCQSIKKKGYMVFVQAMVSLCYTDDEFLQLISSVNEFEPYAFYIVDSFGMMKRKDLVRLFYMVEHNLKKDIWIGFHSHNNMQLAYSNAQSLVDLQSASNIIVDTSIYGMGRGAGNLNTELFVEYLNEHMYMKYKIKPLLTIIDDILNGFYQRNYWGYSLPNYLSAVYHTHPNYAGYLDAKKTLTVEAMADIFAMMCEEKRFEFDRDYIETLYLKYMTSRSIVDDRQAELKKVLCGQKILLVAPGRSILEEKDNINKFVSENDVIIISINFEYDFLETDYIFVSNLRRFRDLDESKYDKCIVTSNIVVEDVYMQVDYQNLLNPIEAVKDNAGMMAIKFLFELGVNCIYLAGYDGYSHDETANYADNQSIFVTTNSVLDAMNVGMNKLLKKYAKENKIQFVTEPKYLTL